MTDYMIMRSVYHKDYDCTLIKAENIKDCVKQYLDYYGHNKEVIIRGLESFDIDECNNIIEYANMFLDEDDVISNIAEICWYAKPMENS